MNVVTRNEEETLEFANKYAQSLSYNSVLLLNGELGAGKTCFVRGLCEGLGGDPTQVNSPTFAIVQEYELPKNKRLVHIDAYRLSGIEELETIGWEELLSDSSSIIAIEWPTRISSALPTDAVQITIEHVSEHERFISIRYSSSGDNA